MRISDWSSDVCSSDLQGGEVFAGLGAQAGKARPPCRALPVEVTASLVVQFRIMPEDAVAERQPPIARQILLQLGQSGHAVVQRNHPRASAFDDLHSPGKCKQQPCDEMKERSEEQTSELQSLKRK